MAEQIATAAGMDTLLKNMHIIQVTNVAPSASIEQMKELFGFLGKIKNIKIYPSDNYLIDTQSKVCYVQYSDSWSVGVAQHLTNTVFIDRALIVVPIPDGVIPDESKALALIDSNLQGFSSGLSPVINEISGVDGTLVITTIDPRLTALGLPQYPPLPANMDPTKIEEIRRTVCMGNLAVNVTADKLLNFVNQIGEVKYVRMAGDDTQNGRFAFVEFTEQTSVANILQYNGVLFEGLPLKVTHSSSAIVKPQSKGLEMPQKDIDEAMKRVKEAQSLIAAAIEPELSSKKRSRRSRSRSRSRHRSRSRSHRRRRSHSRRRSRSSHRSRRRSPSPSKRSRRERSRSRSRGKKKPSVSPIRKKGKSRSRSRDRTRRRHRTKSRSHSRSKSVSKSKSSKMKDKKSSRKRSPSREKSKKESSVNGKPETKVEKTSGPPIDTPANSDFGPPILTPEIPVENSESLDMMDEALLSNYDIDLRSSKVENDISQHKSGGHASEDEESTILNHPKRPTTPPSPTKSLSKDSSSTPDKNEHKAPKSDSRSPTLRTSCSPSRKRSSPHSKPRSPSPVKSSHRKKSRSPDSRRKRSRSGSRQRSGSVKRSGHASPRRYRRRSATPKRYSRSPRRQSRSPRRRSPRRSRSRSFQKRSGSPRRSGSPGRLHGSKRPSPFGRRSRSPKRRSRSRSPKRESRHHKRRKKSRERSTEPKKKKKSSRSDRESSKEMKVYRNCDEEEKGYDSGHEGKRESKESVSNTD